MNTHSTSMRCVATVLVALMASVANAGDIVVIMGPAGSAVTKDQVSNVYLGRSKDFKPVDLPESDLIREAFYKKATDRDLAQVKALWSRITFTGQGQPPLEEPSADAVKKAVASDPKAIGYIHKSDVDGTVKVVLELN
jgi:hypothetical protein